MLEGSLEIELGKRTVIKGPVVLVFEGKIDL
jgi:hypothetical protein